jgi:hypothetical protein
MRRSAIYRPKGQLEYLIHLATGNIVTASPHMRIDTFAYRNEQLKQKGLRWFVDPTKIREFAKIPGGKLQPNSHIWFPAKNLQWDSSTKTFSSDHLRYFDMISDHTIRITGKTGEVREFSNPEFKRVKVDSTEHHVLIWKNADLRFVFAWNRSGAKSNSIEIAKHC